MKRLKYGVVFLAAILACLGLTAARAVERGKLPLAADLSQEAKIAREQRIPILVLFSSPGCVYCNRVRSEVLIPTTLNADYDNKVIMREVEVGSHAKLIDFDGKRITQAQFAAAHKVSFTPTVKLFDARGREVANPIVGLVTLDYYGGMLDQNIEQAIARIREGSAVAGELTRLSE